MQITRKKTFTILFFLFGLNELSAGLLARTDGCEIRRNIIRWNKHDFCAQANALTYISNSQPLAYLYFKIPKLDDKFIEYAFRKTPQRVDKAIPILIEFNSQLMNQQKQFSQHYQTSSKYKDEMISTNLRIKKVNCLYFASGSEYRLPIPAQASDVRVIVYYDFGADQEIKRNLFIDVYKYYEHRSLFLSNFNFEKAKEYELKMEVNPKAKFSFFYPYDVNGEKDLNGFNISIQELPPNTKFAFDGKDDVGKTHEDIKKEFILHDDGSKYVDPDNCYYDSISDWWNNRCTEREN
jgi:hypothetical protein